MSTRTWLATDYYELLGVEQEAGAEEIARAFRASAKDHHPDRTDDDAARERFKALSAAYGVLGNPQRRAHYDELRAAPPVEIQRGPARAPHRAANPPRSPVADANRPLSVRAFPERRHGRWASIGGVVLLVAGVLATGLVVWLVTSGSGRTANGSDATGRDLTLALVALKLVVVGAVFVALGNRRRRYP